MTRLSKLLGRLFLIGAGMVSVWLVAWHGRPGGRLWGTELRTLDYRFRLRGPQKCPLQHVLLVAIDDMSLQRDSLGSWPWDRAIHAAVAKRLSEYGARAVVFDVFFVEPGRTRRGDAELASVAKSTGHVFIATFGVRQLHSFRRSKTNISKFGLDVEQWQERALPWTSGFAAPVKEIADSVRGLGFADLSPDPDGIYRRYFPVCGSREDNKAYCWLPVCVVAGLRVKEPRSLEVTRSHGVSIREAGLHIPTDSRGRALLNCYGNPVPRISCADLLDGKVETAQIRGKICVVGATAPGLGDIRPIAINPRAFGAEILAESIERLLQGDVLRELDDVFHLSIILCTGGLVVLLGSLLKPLPALTLSGAVCIAYNAAVLQLFIHQGWVLPMAAPNLAMGLGCACTAIPLWIVTERTAWKLQRSLSLYVPPPVAAELAADPDEVKLEGERRILTMVVTDLRGFTGYAETSPPETVVNRLNRYFSKMVEIAWRNGGTVDKFIGDGLFVFFNAPLTQDDHALRAVVTAMEMRRELEDLNSQWMQSGEQPFDIGVAINTGEAVVGNMGAIHRRLTYTAIGDQVNVTFELEGWTKKLGHPVLMTGNTYDLVRECVVAEDLGEIQIPGRQQKIRVYALLGLKEHGGIGEEGGCDEWHAGG